MGVIGKWKIIFNGLMESMIIEDVYERQFGAKIVRDLGELLSESSVSEIREMMEMVSFSRDKSADGLRDLIENGTNRNEIEEMPKIVYIVNFDKEEFVYTDNREESGWVFSFKEIIEMAEDLVGKEIIPKEWTFAYHMSIGGKGRRWVNKKEESTDHHVMFGHLNYIR